MRQYAADPASVVLWQLAAPAAVVESSVGEHVISPQIRVVVVTHIVAVRAIPLHSSKHLASFGGDDALGVKASGEDKAASHDYSPFVTG